MENSIALTKEKLGNLFKKPTLKDKFLKKPPFRFIHDCCSAIRKNTGFLDGIWSGDMLNGKAACFKRSAKKVEFLADLICAVEVTLVTKIDVEASKIIKGEEAINTNHLLQSLGDAALLVQSGSVNMEDVLNWMKDPESRFSSSPEPAPSQPESIQPEIEEEQSKPVSIPVSEPKPIPPQIDPKYAEPKQQVDYSDTSYIKETQLILQNIFGKPPLKSKLLTRPPIRFLLDVAKAIKKETGFFDTISDGMLDGKKFKAMKGDAKKKFQKKFIITLIKYIESHGGPKIEATPKSIAQGNNAEATNKMLQIIGKMSTGQYISSKSEIGQPAPPVENQETTQAAVVEEKTKPVATGAKHKKQIEKKEIKKNSSKSKKRDHPSSKHRRESKEKSTKKKLQPSKNEKAENKKSDNPKIIVQEASRSNDALPPRPPTKERGDSGGGHLTVARQGPPRPHSQKSRTSDRSRSRTPSMIISDGAVDEDELAEDHFGPVSEVEFNKSSNSNAELLGAAENQGKLVREIMGQSGQERPASTKTNLSTESNKQEEQINFLRDDIQSICTSVIPLGKCLDFVFEDIEQIKQEFKKYKVSHDKYKKQLCEEKERTELELKPLTSTLKQRISERDQLIKQINEKKASIAQNQKKMEEQLCKMIGLEI